MPTVTNFRGEEVDLATFKPPAIAVEVRIEDATGGYRGMLTRYADGGWRHSLQRWGTPDFMFFYQASDDFEKVSTGGRECTCAMQNPTSESHLPGCAISTARSARLADECHGYDIDGNPLSPEERRDAGLPDYPEGIEEYLRQPRRRRRADGTAASRGRGAMSAVPPTWRAVDRYLAIVAWARRRYQSADGGWLHIATGSKPSIYSRIEDAAAAKLLGCKRRWPTC